MIGHGHPLEELDALEGAADPEAAPFPHRHPVDPSAVEHDGAVIGVLHARQAVEQRRLARTVGTDEAHGLAGIHVDRHVFEGHDAPELLGEAGGHQERA